MGVKLYLNEDKNPKKAILWIAKVLLLALVCLAASMLGFLVLSHLMRFGLGEKSMAGLGRFMHKLMESPLFLFEAYGKWWSFFKEAIFNKQFSPALMVPAFAPLIFILIMVLAYVKSSYSFSLWYRLYNHFAKEEDVEKMGVLNGLMMALGRFGEAILGTNRTTSVLCVGEDGCGKTSGVTIPTVLRSDNASMIIADNSGTVAKYTSGYRSHLGKVFYFNWDLQDDVAKGSYYPRWNPISTKNMPHKGEKRDEYLAFIARYMVAEESKINKENYWQWLAFVAMETGLQFLLSKVEQACANDYFLGQIVENGRLSRDDKDVLLTYYAVMPQPYAKIAMEKISKPQLCADDYMPIGSWAGIPEPWQGKEANLSMFADWLLNSYFEEQSKMVEQHGDGWKPLLEKLLNEALIFNYNSKAIMGLRQLSYLSKKQRSIVFPMLLKPLTFFRNSSVRERTSCSDFYTTQIRGIKDPESKLWEPVTLYCSANNKNTKFINRLFIDTLIKYGLGEHRNTGPLPLMVVMEDFGQSDYYQYVPEGVLKGPQNKMLFLLLSSSLHKAKELYGLNAVEDIVSNTPYKVIMADDNHKLSRQLNKLAVYGSRSVQIPAVNTGAFLKVKNGLADASYYSRLAKEFLSRRNVNVITRGYQMFLVQGFYHLPVLAKTILFLQDDKFRNKALLDAQYFLSDEMFKARNVQDNEVPELNEVLCEKDIGIDDDTELMQFLDLKYNEALEQIETVPDKTSVLADDISSKWQNNDENSDNSVAIAAAEKGGNEDWWLEEDSFSFKSDARENPNPFDDK